MWNATLEKSLCVFVCVCESLSSQIIVRNPISSPEYGIGVIATFILLIIMIIVVAIGVTVVCCKRRRNANRSGKEGVPLRSVWKESAPLTDAWEYKVQLNWIYSLKGSLQGLPQFNIPLSNTGVHHFVSVKLHSEYGTCAVVYILFPYNAANIHLFDFVTFTTAVNIIF